LLQAVSLLSEIGHRSHRHPCTGAQKGADCPQDFRLRAVRRDAAPLWDTPPALVVAFSLGCRAVYCFSSLRGHFEGYRGCRTITVHDEVSIAVNPLNPNHVVAAYQTMSMIHLTLAPPSILH
jgi:hypothetical protein